MTMSVCLANSVSTGVYFPFAEGDRRLDLVELLVLNNTERVERVAHTDLCTVDSSNFCK